jgi:hypothetical protein
MKTLLTILSVLVCAVCFGQPQKVDPITPEKVQAVAMDTTYSYQGFTAYLVIQTSEVTKEQIEFAKKLTKYVKDQHGILYITIQSGIPPCVPTPVRPCPK